jgi:hypothetical protein
MAGMIMKRRPVPKNIGPNESAPGVLKENSQR